MKTLTVCFKLALLVFIVNTNAIAQKLPNKQESSLRAPTNIKIDGKTTEWNNKFQAYNSATEIYYSLSNDDSNLYLIIQATQTDIINKILLGGIAFTVNSSDKMSDKEGATITYPTFFKNQRPLINLNNKPAPVGDTTLKRMQVDSFMHVANKKLTDK